MNIILRIRSCPEHRTCAGINTLDPSTRISGCVVRMCSIYRQVLLLSCCKNGDALRCFVAKDRVSVSRYLFIKKYGRESEINLRTCGGYIDGFSVTNMEVSCKTVGQLGGRIKVKDKPRMRSVSSKPVSKDINKTRKKKRNI